MKNIANILNNNGVVLSATDTVYGLLANANSPEAIEKIYAIKNRNNSKPLAIFCKNVEQIKQVAEFSTATEKLLSSLLPGTFTFILNSKKESNISLIKDFQYKTIGVRIPDSEKIQEILNLVDFPIAATSANISNNPDTSIFAGVDKSILLAVDLILQDDCKIEKQASCVVDLTSFDKNQQFSILRPAPSEAIFMEYLKKYHNA